MAEYYLFKILFSNLLDVGGFAPISGITKIACAIICLGKEGCSSYFYHADEMSCVPSLTRHFNTSVLDNQDGYQYFILWPDCGENWELFNGECYYFEYERKSFEQARINCLEKGGYLAKTDSDAENDLFISLSQRGTFWLGGKKEGGIWKWLDGSPYTSLYWAAGQPSGGTNCLQQLKGTNGHDDEDCSTPRHSLCEK